MSIQSRIALSLLIFSLVVLLIVLILQQFFLEPIFMSVRMAGVNNQMKRMQQILEEPDYREKLTEIAYHNDIRIEISEMDGDLLFTSSRGGVEYDRYSEDFLQYINYAAAHNGEARLYFADDIRNTGIPPFDTRYLRRSQSGVEGNRSYSSLLLIRIVPMNGQDCALISGMLIRPHEPTRDTMRIIFVVLSVFTLSFALFFAYYLARMFSRPIEKLSKEAGELAEGNLNVRFSDSRIREISELSGTLDYAAKELKKTGELQRDLVANVSHELRTPIAAIRGFAEVMRDIPGENTPENLQVVIDEAERLNRLVNEIMDLSQLQANVLQLHPEDYSITDSIRRLCERYRRLLNVNGYRLLFEPSENVCINADEDKIYQVLYNFISNALAYAGADKLVRVTQIVADDKVTIGVTDYGVAIPPEETEKVFKRFYRSNAPENLNRVGSGVGLAIAKGILELHQAEYGIQSSEGQETTFWFRLPARSSEPLARENEVREPQNG